MFFKLAAIVVLCVALQGCGIGAFYCLEKKSNRENVPLCDVW